jgi:hypothetical protein
LIIADVFTDNGLYPIDYKTAQRRYIGGCAAFAHALLQLALHQAQLRLRRFSKYLS